MKPPRRGFLSMLDDTVRWTGMPARVAKQMSDEPGGKHRPLRWIPIWPIAFSCVLLMISLAWPSVLHGFDLGFTISIASVFWCVILGMVPGIHTNGPLGK